MPPPSGALPAAQTARLHITRNSTPSPALFDTISALLNRSCAVRVWPAAPRPRIAPSYTPSQEAALPIRFTNFYWGCLTSFQIFTLDNWSVAVQRTYATFGRTVLTYYVTITLVGSFAMFVFQAIILNQFDRQTPMTWALKACWPWDRNAGEPVEGRETRQRQREGEREGERGSGQRERKRGTWGAVAHAKRGVGAGGAGDGRKTHRERER